MKNGYRFKNWLKRDSNAVKSPSDKLRCFVDALVDIVASNERNIPTTLFLEDERIRELRRTFDDSILLHSCHKVLHAMAHSRLSAPSAFTQAQRTILSQRLCTIINEPAPTQSQRLESIAVELARHVNSRINRQNSLPCEDTIEWAQYQLEAYTDRSSPFYKPQHTHAVQRLRHAVHLEASRFADLDTVQMARRCQALAGLPNRSSFFTQSWFAMKVAHMAILHWRVWAPILYLREEPSDGETDDIDGHRHSGGR